MSKKNTKKDKDEPDNKDIRLMDTMLLFKIAMILFLVSYLAKDSAVRFIYR